MPFKLNEDEAFIPRYSCKVEKNLLPGLRLDRYIAENLKLLSRSQIKSRKLLARLDNREVKLSHILKGGESLEVFWEDAEPLHLIPENIPLDIVYEDDRVAVINKAQGMVVHPGAGNRNGTLANALYYRRLQKTGETSINSYGTRPGIVHRLDKDTSGLIITAWDEEAHKFIADQFKKRNVVKTYAAIVHGCPSLREGIIDKPIARSPSNRKIFTVDPKGKPSITYYKVLKFYNNYSLLLLRPKTGRTHQIRVHLKSLGHPVLGDPLYGKSDPHFPCISLMLHAKRLSLVLPETDKCLARVKKAKKTTFRIAFPERFNRVFRALNK